MKGVEVRVDDRRDDDEKELGETSSVIVHRLVFPEDDATLHATAIFPLSAGSAAD